MVEGFLHPGTDVEVCTAAERLRQEYLGVPDGLCWAVALGQLRGNGGSQCASGTYSGPQAPQHTNFNAQGADTRTGVLCTQPLHWHIHHQDADPNGCIVAHT